MKEQDIPQEVWWVWAIQWSRKAVGLQTLEDVKHVIRKYPQHFPWETKYNSIPQEVHDAYYKEKHPWVEDDIWSRPDDESYIGLIPTLMKMNEIIKEQPPEPEKSISEMFADLFKMEEDKRRRQKEEDENNKALWDKHYKPYGLEYRK
jgi:hypothetical protein